MDQPVSIIHRVVPDSRPQYTEEAFRRYEPVIQSILSRFPLSSCLNPYPLSPETFVHRLRDALRAFVVSQWVSHVSRDLCLSTFAHLGHGGPFIFSYGEGPNGISLVYIGPRATHRYSAGAVRAANIITAPSGGVLDAQADPQSFMAFAHLKNKDYIEGIVEFSNVSEAQKSEVEQKYLNVELLQEGTTTKMI